MLLMAWNVYRTATARDARACNEAPIPPALAAA
jgi:hypothetical protein